MKVKIIFSAILSFLLSFNVLKAEVNKSGTMQLGVINYEYTLSIDPSLNLSLNGARLEAISIKNNANKKLNIPGSFSIRHFYHDGYDIFEVMCDVARIADHFCENKPQYEEIYISKSNYSVYPKMGRAAFRNCTNLKMVGGIVPHLGNSAFAGCVNLSSIIFIGEEIPDSAFYDCKKLKLDGMFTNLSKLKKIGNYAFANTSFPKIESLPSTILSIGDYAFAYNKKLFDITLPRDLETIGEGAFTGCPDACFSTAYKPFPDSIKKIGPKAFSGSFIGYIEHFPNITRFEEEVFYDCNMLDIKYFPNQVTFFGDRAFKGCRNQPNFGKQMELEHIGEEAFSGCETFTEFTAGPDLKKIGARAFEGCKRFKKFVCYSGKPVPLGADVFSGVPQATGVLYVPEWAIDDYKKAAQWKEWGTMKPLSITRLSETTLTMIPGEESFLTVTSSSTMGNVIRNFKWESSDPDVVQVNSYGRVEAIADGTAEIIVTSPDDASVKGICLVTVGSTIPKSIRLDRSDLYMEKGQNIRLYATIEPKDAQVKTVKWSSSDERVATVDQYGWVRAISGGKARISVESTADKTVNAHCYVEVYDNSGIDEIQADKKEMSLSVEQHTLKITNIAPGETVKIYSTDGRLIHSSTVSDGDLSIEIDHSGMYIIVIGERVEKVII